MARAYIRFTKTLVNMLGAIASGLLILLVLMMCYNVIARYAFSAPTIGLEELTWHAYAAIFLLGIPYALQTQAHVRVDLFYERFSKTTQLKIDLFGAALFLIPTCIVVIYTGWHFTSAAYQLGPQPSSVTEFFNQLVSTGIGEKSQDPGGLLNRWIIKAVIPLSFLFLLLAAISSLLENWLSYKELSRSSATASSSEA